MPRVAHHVHFVLISLAKRAGLRWVGLTKNYPNHLGRCSALVLGCMSILMENSPGSPKLKQLGGHDPDPRATGFPEWAPFQGWAPQRPMNWGKWNIPGSLTSVQPCLPLCGTCAKPSAPQPSSTTAKLRLSRSLRGFDWVHPCILHHRSNCTFGILPSGWSSTECHNGPCSAPGSRTGVAMEMFSLKHRSRKYDSECLFQGAPKRLFQGAPKRKNMAIDPPRICEAILWFPTFSVRTDARTARLGVLWCQSLGDICGTGFTFQI